MSDENRSELKGIAALTNALLRSPFIKPDIHTNDKTESWDGFVYLYRDKTWGVDPLVGRIPIQVKSTKRPFTGDTASFPVRTADLRNYCTEGGVVFFLISLDTAADTSHIFYANLLNEQLNELLCSRQGQKHVTVVLQRFPENWPDEMEQIFRSFLSERSISASSTSQQSESQIMSECKKMLNESISKADYLLECLDRDLKEYILQNFEWYKAQNTAVQTPQILRMLLTYPNDSIVKSIFDTYKTEDGTPYGSFLIEFFQNVDLQYKTAKRIYREQNWSSFIHLLERAEEVLHDFEKKSCGTCITVNILCYAVLRYSGGTTVQMIQRQMGAEEFESISNFIWNDTLPSVPTAPNLTPYVVRCW